VQVIDAETGLPIEGATVEIDTWGRKKDKNVQTDSNGTTPELKLSKKNYFDVTVSAPGYSKNGSDYIDSDEWLEDVYELSPSTAYNTTLTGDDDITTADDTTDDTVEGTSDDTTLDNTEETEEDDTEETSDDETEDEAEDDTEEEEEDEE